MAHPRPKSPKRLARKPASKSARDSLIETAIELVAHVATKIFDRWWNAPPEPARGPSDERPQGQAEASQPKRRQKRPPAWWNVLGIPQDASSEQIKLAYRDLISRSHPDKVAHLSPQLQKVAEREAKNLNAAYEAALQECERR